MTTQTEILPETPVEEDGQGRCAVATGSAASLDDGVWYQSFASGGWYRNRNAAGSITAVRVNGRADHAPVCDNCDQQSELDGDVWQCFSEHCRAHWPTILPNVIDEPRPQLARGVRKHDS